MSLAERRGPAADPERGSAPLFVSAFGLLALTVVLSLSGAAVAEYRNVEDSLAQVRAFWAAQGQAAYVLSRIRQDSPCAGKGCPGDNNPNPPAGGINTYLQELQTAIAANPGKPLWQYPDVGANYAFYVTASANPDNLAPNWTNSNPAGQAKAGEYCLRFTFSPLYVQVSGPAPPVPPAGACSALPPGPAAGPVSTQSQPVVALRTLQRTRPVEVRFCVVGNPAQPCGCTTTSVSPSCAVSTGFDGTLPYVHITSVHRTVN